MCGGIVEGGNCYKRANCLDSNFVAQQSKSNGGTIQKDEISELNDHPRSILRVNVLDPFDAFNFLVVPP